MARPKDLDLFSKAGEAEDRDYLTLLEKFPYRPTLFVGLGGTGALAVANIKRLFQKLYSPHARKGIDGVQIPDIPSMYSFIAFDTNVGDRPKELAKGREWHHLAVADLARFYEGQGKTKFFRDWIVKDYPAGSIMAGASGFRNLGRLALIHNIAMVQEQLSTARGQIMTAGPRLVNTTPIVFVCCSISGGTGSGALIDTCFLLREVFGSGRADIIGMIAVLDGLPTVPEITRRAIRVNTYAALRELNAFMTNKAEGVEFKKRIEYPFNRAGRVEEPFDECYLITPQKMDGTNSLKTQNHLTSFIARTTFMMTAYMFSDPDNQTPDYGGVMNNHRHHLNHIEKGAKLCYLVPGMGQVHFPVATTANLFALDAALNYLRYQSGGDALKGDERARDFQDTEALTYEQLRREIATDPETRDPKTGERTDDTQAWSPRQYDALITDLLDDKRRYENSEQVLSYGKKMANERAKEIESALSANVKMALANICGAAATEDEPGRDSRILARARDYLVEEGCLTLGTINFLQSLRNLLAEEREKLIRESRDGVDLEYEEIDNQWRQIADLVTDVVTDSGLLDMDRLKLPRAKAMYISFLNQAETVVLEKVRNELTRNLLTEMLDYLDDQLGRIRRLFGSDLETATRILSERRSELATQLHHQTEGRDDSVEHISSFNVMTQEWRRNYLENHAPHLRPKQVLSDLLRGGWHPLDLLDAAGEGSEGSRRLAQEVLDRVMPLTGRERGWGPLDVLSFSGQYRGQEPEKVIAHLFFQLLQPQMSIASMKNILSFEPHRIIFCGGIDRGLKQKLQSTDEFQGTTFNVADNMESNRINFFSTTLPVGVAGCDMVLDLLEPEYERWTEELADLRRDEAEQKRKLFHCFTDSHRWPRPTRRYEAYEEEKIWFARALAVSEILDPTEDDLRKMKRHPKGPKEPRYGLFQVGRGQFWLWPFFEPRNPDAVIRGTLTKLGANVMTAYTFFAEREELRRVARQWADWLEESWSRFYNGPEIEERKRIALRTFAERRSKLNDPRQIELWDDLSGIVGDWELG